MGIRRLRLILAGMGFPLRSDRVAGVPFSDRRKSPPQYLLSPGREHCRFPRAFSVLLRSGISGHAASRGCCYIHLPLIPAWDVLLLVDRRRHPCARLLPAVRGAIARRLTVGSPVGAGEVTPVKNAASSPLPVQHTQFDFRFVAR